MLNDLQRRGVADVLIACVDGLAGFPYAIEAVFPQTWMQTCLVHQIRGSRRYVSYQDRRKVAAALKLITGRTTTTRCARCKCSRSSPSTR